jgi:hypothetical protein
MPNLYEPATVEEVKARLARLTPESERLWGTMSAAQAMAHCAAALEIPLGDRAPSREKLVLRLLGRIIKPLALGNDRPMRRNSPTSKDLVVQDERDFGVERERLSALIDRFAAGGPQGCTTAPHSFFGPLTPEEWGELMYKHLDHHLRQFGV